MFKLENFLNAQAIMINSETGDFYIKINGQPKGWMSKWRCTHAVEISKLNFEKIITVLKDKGTNEALIMTNLKLGTFYIKIGSEPQNWMHVWETYCTEDTSQLPPDQLIRINNIKDLREHIKNFWF